MKWLLCGLGGAAAFCALLFPLALPFWLAALVGVAVYVGLFLLLGDDREPYDSLPDADGVDKREAYRILTNARATTKKLRALGRSPPNPAVRQKIDAVCDVVDDCVDALQSDPRDMPVATIFLTQYLETTGAMIRRYLELSRQRRSHSPEAEALVAKGGQAVEEARLAYRKLYDKILKNDSMDLEAEAATFRQMMELERL